MSDTLAAKRPAGKRIYYFDVLRMIGCLCAVLVHATSTFAGREIGSLNFWLAHVPNATARFVVPIFVMISGALMLDEHYHFTVKKQTGHVVKMLCFFLFWSVLYSGLFNVLIPLRQGSSIDVETTVRALIEGPYHLWFCFTIVGLYLIVPLLRLWVKPENKKYVLYFILLSLVFTFLIPQLVEHGGAVFSPIGVFYKTLDDLNLRYVGGYTAYFLTGWYLHNFDVRHKKTLYLLGIAGALVTVVGSVLISGLIGQKHMLYEHLSIHMFVESAALFVLIKNLFKDKAPEKTAVRTKIVMLFSANSLGIYAAHVAVLDLLEKYLLVSMPHFDKVWVHSPVVFLIAVAVSLLISMIMRKIPVLKKIT